MLLALLPAWVAMAWLVGKAQWFWTHNPELQFGWVVLLLCVFLFYEAWETRPEPLLRWSAPRVLLAVLGCGILFLTQLYQSAYGLTPASMSGLGVGVLCVVLASVSFAFGPAGVRHFAFAFLFFFIALPIPSIIYNPIVTGLQNKVAALNVEFLNLIGVPARQVGSLIHLPNGTVGVDEACSGIRSLQSTIMATLFIGYLTLKHRGLQLTLLCSGILLAITGNVIRSLFLSLVANAKGVKSVGNFHDTAGWSILAFTAIGVGILAWLFARLERQLHTQLKVEAPSAYEPASDEPAGPKS